MRTESFLESNRFDHSLSALLALRDLPVWSLIVTVFGDLARNPGDGISGPLLSAILEPMGVKSEASRVALHRLRNDGWIASHKTGRTGVHHLTGFGFSQSASARHRIYNEPEFQSEWHLLIARTANVTDAGYIQIMPKVYLGNGPAPVSSEMFTICGSVGSIPDWLHAQIETPALVAGYSVFNATLKAVQANPAGHLTPVETAVIRTLIVHHWRRLVLRHPPLPESFHSSGWQGTKARNRTFALLNTLPRPNLQELEDSI